MSAEDADESFMDEALEVAKRGLALGEVPVGVLAVSANGRVVASAHNRVRESLNPSLHAEILVIHDLCDRNISNTTLYTSCEPCVMCMDAITRSKRVSRLVYGCSNPVFGGDGSVCDRVDRFGVLQSTRKGVREAEAVELLKQFYALENRME